MQTGGGEVLLVAEKNRWELGFSTKLIFISSFCKLKLKLKQELFH